MCDFFWIIEKFQFVGVGDVRISDNNCFRYNFVKSGQTRKMEMYKMSKSKVVVIGVFLIGCFSSCQLKVSNNPIPNQEQIEATDGSNAVSYLENITTLKDEEWSIKMLMELKKTKWNTDEGSIYAFYERYPTSISVCELVSEYYLHVGKYEKASVLINEAFDLGANNADSYKIQALTAAHMKQYDLAIDYINKAILINRNDSEMYKQKGEVYLAFGDTVSALTYLERAFLSDSTRNDIGLRVAEVNVTLGKLSSAEQWLRKVLVASPNNSDYKLVLSKVYRAQNKNFEANQLLSALLGENHMVAGENLMSFFSASNQLDSLFFYSNRVLEIDTLNLQALNYKADIFDVRGYYSSALMYYEKTLSVDSLNKEASRGIAKVNGKIAYLRKLKEQRESLTTFDLTVPEKKENID